jgi:uncharacterized protein YycO
LLNYRKGDYVCIDLTYPLWKAWDWIPNKAIKHFTHSQFSHAFVVVSDGGYIVEARPTGAQLGHIQKYIDAGYKMQVSTTNLTDQQRDDIAKNAISFIGTPYNFADIAYLALYTNGLQWNWLLKKIVRIKSMICSQLVAESGVMAGVTSWQCGKSDPQLVTPADLDRLTAEQAPYQYLRQPLTGRPAYRRL